MNSLYLILFKKKQQKPCFTCEHTKTQAQVLLVLMGGLESEALVVMVADPCPL